MTTMLWLKYALIANVVTAITALVFMANRRVLRDYYALASFLLIDAIECSISVSLLYYRKNLGLSKMAAYNFYFYSHMAAFLLEYAVLLVIIYSVFQTLIRPFEGLHRAGKMIFRWVAGVSLAVTVAFTVGPNAGVPHYIYAISGRVQQGINVLILCLLLFVCFSTRLLGLTYRSRIFGVTLGLGVFATTGLVESAWYATAGAQGLYSPMYLVASLGSLVALSVWGAYFAMPEAKREMVLLPTTSPYFFWNRVSEALGAKPGYVAVAGFKPEMLSSAELNVMTSATKFAREKERREAIAREEAEVVAQSPAPLQTVGIRH